MRISRHTSTPEIRGSMTSSSTSAGRTASKRAIASAPSAAVSTTEPFAFERDATARRGTTARRRRRGSTVDSAIRRSPAVRTAPRPIRAASGRMKRNVEPSPSTDSTVTSPPWACATWRTIDEAEAGTTGGAAARLVDAVEALEDALEVAARDADPVRRAPRSRRVAVERGARPSTGLPGFRVLHRVVEQVGDRAHHLAAVARDQRAGDPRMHLQVDAARRPPPGAPGRPRRRRASSERDRATRRGASCVSMRLRSSRSSTMRASRSASFTMRSASGRVTAGSLLGHQRLGEHLERADRRLELVAHVGDEVAPHALDAVHLRDVARRTRRRRAGAPRGRAGPRGRCTTACGGPKSCSSRSHALPEQGLRDAARRAPAGDHGVGVAGVAVALGRGVAEHLDAVGVERRARPGAARRARPGTGRVARRRSRSRCSALASACSDAAFGLRRVAAGSSASAEPPGDVALGAGVGRAR